MVWSEKNEGKMKAENPITQNEGLNQEVATKALEALGNLFDAEGEGGIRFVLSELFKSKNIKMITDLAVPEINVIDRAIVYHDSIFNDKTFKNTKPILKKFFDEMMILRVSKMRQSRTEYIDGFKAEQSNILQEKSSNLGKIR